MCSMVTEQRKQLKRLGWEGLYPAKDMHTDVFQMWTNTKMSGCLHFWHPGVNKNKVSNMCMCKSESNFALSEVATTASYLFFENPKFRSPLEVYHQRNGTGVWWTPIMNPFHSHCEQNWWCLRRWYCVSHRNTAHSHLQWFYLRVTTIFIPNHIQNEAVSLAVFVSRKSVW